MESEGSSGGEGGAEERWSNSDASEDENFSRGPKSIESPPESPPRGGGNLDSPPASPASQPGMPRSQQLIMRFFTQNIMKTLFIVIPLYSAISSSSDTI
jgi:hypothetical protein